MNRKTTYTLENGVRYYVSDERYSVLTSFEDGASCHGVATFDQEQHDRARALGYGEGEEAVWEMHREHDLLHTIVSQAQGWPWSPTLWAAAHGVTLPPGIIPQEERLVFLAQRIGNEGKFWERES